MKKYPLFLIGLVSVFIAITVVIVLNLLGHSNPIVFGGGVAGGVVGGIAGAISANLLKRKKK